MKIIFAFLLLLFVGSCNEPVEACFSVSQSSPIPVNSLVTFNCTCTTGGNGTNTWDFGDGSPKVTSSSATVSHIYSTPGTYTILMTAGGSYQTMRKEHPSATQSIIVQ